MITFFEYLIIPFYFYAFYKVFSFAYYYRMYEGVMMHKDDIKKMKQWYKENPRKYIPVEKFQMKHKICTQTQPFMINDKEGYVCNFPCDGICRLK